MSNKVFSFPPSTEYDGSNGNWSSFSIRIGTPEQNFRVLPVPGTGQVLVPGPAGCPARYDDVHNCAARRGVENTHYTGFQSNDSETWKAIGTNMTWPVLMSKYLGVEGEASYGTDHVGLMVPNSGGPNLKDQVVGSLLNRNPFFIGFFGLDPQASNFSDYKETHSSFMTNLKDSGQISSLSYGYTAGASYRIPKVPGSLTLGGYDESRFKPANITFPFNDNDQQATSLFLQDIRLDPAVNSTRSMLDGSIYVNIDFTLPFLWLPATTCGKIASLFNLQYDSFRNLYLTDTNDDAEEAGSRPSLNFDLSPLRDGGERVSINIPYSALNLDGSWPFFNDTTKYFPMKNASDPSQYTLGRAFMQEAYIIVDYERQNFLVRQAIVPESKQQKLVPILAKDAVVAQPKTGLSRRSIIGITIGSSCAFVILILVAWFYYRRWRRLSTQLRVDHKMQEDVRDSPVVFELTERCEIRSELVGVQVSELRAVSTRRHELPCQ